MTTNMALLDEYVSAVRDHNDDPRDKFAKQEADRLEEKILKLMEDGDMYAGLCE